MAPQLNENYQKGNAYEIFSKASGLSNPSRTIFGVMEGGQGATTPDAQRRQSRLHGIRASRDKGRLPPSGNGWLYQAAAR